jgi:hypothetical protein
MAIPLDTLAQAATRTGFTKTAATLSEARSKGLRTAFLSHSSADSTYAAGIQALLREAGCNVYIYTQDPGLAETPSKESAQRVQRVIVSCDLFLFLATPNSMRSRWCPWEIGYADGAKAWKSIYVIPTSDRSGSYHGSEYLQIYQKIDIASDRKLAAFEPNAQRGTYVSSI